MSTTYFFDQGVRLHFETRTNSARHASFSSFISLTLQKYLTARLAATNIVPLSSRDAFVTNGSGRSTLDASGCEPGGRQLIFRTTSLDQGISLITFVISNWVATNRIIGVKLSLELRLFDKCVCTHGGLDNWYHKLLVNQPKTRCLGHVCRRSVCCSHLCAMATVQLAFMVGRGAVERRNQLWICTRYLVGKDAQGA